MNYDYFQWDWFGINIVVPVLGPLLVLWLFSLPTKVAGLNSLESIPSAPPPTPTANPHIPDKFIFGSSIIFLLAVIGTYTVVHAKLLEQEANIRKNAIMKIQECVAKHKANAEHCVEDMK